MVPLCDPHRAYLDAREAYDAAWHRVMQSGFYILGSEVQAFESEFASAMGSRFAIGVANGTAAIELVLRALDIGTGDLVLLPSHTAVPTAAAVRATGATPVWVEIDPRTFVFGVDELERSFDAVKRAGWEKRVKAVIAVHLYGHPVDLAGVADFCERAGLALIEDCAQAHGAMVGDRPVGSIGLAGTFSFYPTKNVPAFGDGGAITTSDPELADRLRRIRQYGWRERYVSEEVGTNSRLDELQAALLRVSLAHLGDWNARRVEVAGLYDSLLRSSLLALPHRAAGVRHVYHQYVVRSDRRDELKSHLAAAGIGCGILYPCACHQQPAYRTACPVAVDLRHTEESVRTLLCLPVFPQLDGDEVRRIARHITDFFTLPVPERA
jgi:dTDP-4-amino-4,6-dideoxygalactose transaminase